MLFTASRTYLLLLLALAAASCKTPKPPDGSRAAVRAQIHADIASPALRAKAIAIDEHHRLRRAHEQHKGNPTILNVKVRAEERRPAGYSESLGSINPLEPTLTEDIRLDSDLVIDLITERKPLGSFGADKAIAQLAEKFQQGANRPIDTVATSDVIAATEELERLYTWITEDLGEISANIEAFLIPTEGERTRVHVSNYDTIAGSVQGAKIEVPNVRLGRQLAAEQAMKALAAREALEEALKTFYAQPANGVAPAKVAAFTTARTALTAVAKKLKAAVDDANKDLLGGLPSGRIALRKLGIKHGDRMDVRVVIERQRNGVTTTDQITFNARMVQIGIYSKIGGNLIYARADSGPGTAQTWKPNAAASLEWHYRTIYADSGGEKLWNWLDPGFGVHIASLDQIEDQATELGIGLNASIWGGFLQGGVGYNLNASKDHVYYYFGIDLLKVLADTDE